jgi:hypothetical protein
MPFLKIDGVRTMNQSGQNAALFDPFNDALSLTLDIHASADLLTLSVVSYTAEFQIFDPHTHEVVVSRYSGGPFAWGPYFWISMGNNWGPPASYQTPERWGLSWVTNSIFGRLRCLGHALVPGEREVPALIGGSGSR